ncbi:MAG: RNA methyltransferase [Ignavibacteria bacterium]
MNRVLTNNELKFIASLKFKKYRDLHGMYLIEGEHLLSEFIKSGKKGLKYVIRRHDFDNEFIINKLPAIYTYKVNNVQFDKLSDTKSPQGILAVVKKSEEKKLLCGKIVVALDSINDPGNLGTILRTCYWYGIESIIIGKNSADVYNTKTIRASQGALFYVNFNTEADLNLEFKSLKNNGYNIYLTTLTGNVISDKTISKGKAVIVFGNEANGISKELIENKEYKEIKIKSFTGCESLNVSVTVGIVINEFKRLFEN